MCARIYINEKWKGIDDMNSNGVYRCFVPLVNPKGASNKDIYWFVFYNGNLLVEKKEDRFQIPLTKELNGIRPIRKQYLGTYNDIDCYSAEAENDKIQSEKTEYHELRSLYGSLEEDFYLIAGKAVQIVNWDKTHQYCGQCGSKTITKSDERAKVCNNCGFMSFPRISPAIIVAVVNEGKLLLAHANHFKNNMYSVIAGFVEAGETLEECVKREVFEEVGINVKNVKYFGSQSWPFPNSLMVAFTAEYESGEIKVDGVEIAHAYWFGKDNLPNIPTGISISRRLIDWYIKNI
jgi:NAD+ diphosphatase